MSPYHVLGVAPDADIAVLRASYRKLVRIHHPDCAPDETARVVAAARMVKINWAWHIVSDAGRRAAFDARHRVEQIEAARRGQEHLRAQARGQAVRGAQAHLADILKAQAAQRQEQNRRVREQQVRDLQARGRQTSGRASRERPETNEPSSPSSQEQRAQGAREQQFLEWQALERARQEREARAKREAQQATQRATRPARKGLTREEKHRHNMARARLRRMRSEDKKRSSAPSARRQLAEAARLFAQEGRASDAIAMCHDVLRTDGRNVPARELLGDFYLRLGRQDRALPLWEQALALQPSNSSVRRKLNALRPHDPTSYDPQPRIPRPQNERVALHAGRRSFWHRLRQAFLGGL